MRGAKTGEKGLDEEFWCAGREQKSAKRIWIKYEYFPGVDMYTSSTSLLTKKNK